MIEPASQQLALRDVAKRVRLADSVCDGMTGGGGLGDVGAADHGWKVSPVTSRRPRTGMTVVRIAQCRCQPLFLGTGSQRSQLLR